MPAWRDLQTLSRSVNQQSIAAFFEHDSNRVSKFTLRSGELLLDFSKNLVSDSVWSALIDLANQSPLNKHRHAMFSGKAINTTEHRAVLHTALRAESGDQPGADAEKRISVIKQQLDQIKALSEKIRDGRWLGSTGKAITDVVNIGIGGSNIGPKLACGALREYAHPQLNMHFISNADGAQVLTTLSRLSPQTTVIIIASKTFTTQETMLNAKTTRNWFAEKLGLEDAQRTRHFIGLTANRQKALDYGIPGEQVLEFSEWVGGRYSLWSSIGLPIAICIGYERFTEMLAGAREMDRHFQSAPFEENMPVTLALLGIWYRNFLGAQSIAVVPYCERLSLLPSYLQQLDMESNGKSITLNGEPVDYATGPILWGQTGTLCQHAFFQLLHQGTHRVPVDFIAAINDPLSNQEHHSVLLRNMLAQACALMTGRPATGDEPYKYCPGNNPSNVLLMHRLSPKNLGALLALYEHKVFVQGSIWNINSFDQWGVELAKKMAHALLSPQAGQTKLDASTQKLFEYIQKNRQC